MQSSKPLFAAFVCEDVELQAASGPRNHGTLPNMSLQLQAALLWLLLQTALLYIWSRCTHACTHLGKRVLHVVCVAMVKHGARLLPAPSGRVHPKTSTGISRCVLVPTDTLEQEGATCCNVHLCCKFMELP